MLIYKLNAPKAQSVGENSFAYCEDLISASLNGVKTFADKSAAYFVDCYSLKSIYLPSSDFCPDIKWSDAAKSKIGKTKVPQLESIYAPKATNCYSTADNPFGEKCLKLKYVFIPQMEKIDVLGGESCTVYYFDDALTEIGETANGAQCSAVGLTGSYTESRCRQSGIKFIAAECCSYSGKDKAGITYLTADGEELALPNEIVKSAWSADMINKNKSDKTYAYLLDFNNDGIVNAKDYAVLNRL